MANVIENVITARDEATPKLVAVRAEIGRMSAALNSVPSRPAPGLVPHLTLVQREIRGVGTALTQLAPQATGALAPMQSLLALGSASLGPIGIGAAAVAVSIGSLALVAKTAADEVGKLGEQAEKISNLAQSTGVAVSNVQGLQVALENAGIPSESLIISFRTLNKAISEQDPKLKALGITSKDTFAAFLQLSDLFARSADGPNKTAAAVAILGRSGEQLIPVLNQGSDALRGMIDEARAMGLTFSNETVKALVEVDDKFDKLGNQVKGLRNEFFLLAVPAVSGAVDQLNKLLTSLKALPKAFDDLRATIESAPGFAKIKEWTLNSQDFDRMASTVKDLEGLYKRFKESVGVASSDMAQTTKRSVASQADDLDRITAKVKVLMDTWRAAGSLGKIQGPLTSSGSFGGSQNVPTESEASGIPNINTKPAVTTEREKMLARLQELLHLTRTEARAAYDDLKRLDDSAAALSLVGKLDQARTGTSTGKSQNVPTAAEAGVVQISEVVRAQEMPDFKDVALAFKATIDEMTTTAAVAAEFINGTFVALSGSLAGVFQGVFADLAGIPGQVMTLAKAVKSIIASMVNSVLAELARMAAAKFFLLLIKLLGGSGLPTDALKSAAAIPYGSPALRSQGGLIRGPGTSTSDSIPARLSAGEYVVRASSVQRPGILSHLEAINRGTMALSGFSAPTSQATQNNLQGASVGAQDRTGGNTYVIQAISARDAILSLTQPGGELRQAMDHVQTMGAY